MPHRTNRTSAALLVTLTASVALTAELVRFSGPQFDYVLNNAGVISAALTALGTYLAPALLTFALSARRSPSGPMVLVAVAALVIARSGLQFLDGTVRLGVGLATVALAISTTTIVAAALSRHGGMLVARGVFGGLLVSAAINLLLGTLDAMWHEHLLAFVPTALVLAAALVSAWLARDVAPAPRSKGLWAIGPVLTLGTVVFANPAFISSQTGLALWVSGLIMAVSAMLCTFVLARNQQPVRLLAFTLVASTALVYFLASWPEPNSILGSFAIAVGIAILAISSFGLLITATERSSQSASSVSLAGVSAGIGLLVILPILLFQLDYDIPLGFPNEFIMVGLSVVLAAGALVIARAEKRAGRLPSAPPAELASRPMIFASAGVAIASIAALGIGSFAVSSMYSMPGYEGSSSNVTLMNWNLHYGLALDGSVSLEQMAREIDEVNPDVLALQEVSRGWIMAGGSDMLTYLANKLNMEFAFVGAADNQFGNAILWKKSLRQTAMERTALTYGDGPQWRSAIAGTFNVRGQDVNLVSVHLQHRDDNTPTRLAQLEDLFENLHIGGTTIIAGDFNSQPGWREIKELEKLEFTSAIDSAGDPAALTFPANQPDVRIDWVFGRSVEFSDVKVLDSTASDHLPIVAVVSTN